MSNQSPLLWHDPDWRKPATDWIHAEAERHSIRITGEIEQPHTYAWSTVLHVPTDQGTLFFKATAHETIHEAALTHWFPDCMPELVAVDVTHGWMLMRDSGEQLRASVRPTQDVTPRRSQMLKRTLGKSKLEVSALGMGCWAIGGPWIWAQPGKEPYPAGWGNTDDDESIRAVHAAMDMGVNFFDTAANYGAGHSEVVLGRALKGKRDKAVIATKFGHIVNEKEKTVYGDRDQIIKNVRTDVENSLRRLQTDTIDIYQLHDGGYPPKLALELQTILEELVSAGKIRWYGWSTDVVESAHQFARAKHCTSIQFRLNAIFDNPEMRQVCAGFDLAGINKDPLNKGFLTGKFNSASTFPENDVRYGTDFSDPELVKRLKIVDEIRDILTSGGRTMAQGALAYIWALDERMVPIPGFKSVKQVTENAGALQFGPLTELQVKEIQEIVAKYELKG